jgi:hypothetical protein
MVIIHALHSEVALNPTFTDQGYEFKQLHIRVFGGY